MYATACALAKAAGRVTTGRRVTLQLTKAPIAITDEAASRLQNLLSKRPDALGIRVGVAKRGCNGLSYTMNYAEEKGKLDEVVEDKGVKILIDPKAAFTIFGTLLDWKEDKISAEFVFNNPNVDGLCGCGESFNPKTSAR